MKKELRIPTILGLALLAGGLILGLLVVRKTSPFRLRADPTKTPKRVKITNVTERSFTVSWITDEPQAGFVKIGKAGEEKIMVTDKRDGEKGGEARLTHYVTIAGLEPNTAYYFKLGSGGKHDLYDNEGKDYKVATAPLLETPPKAEQIFGKITKSDGSPAEGAIVYLSMPGAVPMSALVGSNGSWSIPIGAMRSVDLKEYANYDESTVVEIFVQGEKEGEVARARTTVANASPLPTLVLGKSYDFIEDEGKEEREIETQEASPAASKFSLVPIEGVVPVAREEVKLENPAREGEAISTTKPEFWGKGEPGTVLTIKVESEMVYIGSVVVGDDGEWRWTVPKDLTPGEHRITIAYIDSSGEERTISRSFKVLASGESELPAFEATPSAETITPTPTATATPTLSPTPTATPAARTAMPSTAGGTPTSGNIGPTLMLTSAGVILMLIGSWWGWRKRE